MARDGYSGEERRQKAAGFRLSREISIADIVAVTCIGIPALIWAGKIDTRIAQMESEFAMTKRDLMATDARHTVDRENLRREVKEDLREINRKLDQLIERNGRKP